MLSAQLSYQRYEINAVLSLLEKTKVQETVDNFFKITRLV